MNNCIFCKIVNNEIEAKKVAENKFAVAFLDAFPISAGHCLIVPKKHYDNLSECPKKILNKVSLLVGEVVNKLKKSNLDIKGFNYLSNEQKIAGQEIMHFHVHIIPKYSKKSGFNFTITKEKNLNKAIENKINNELQKLIINK